jgi:hypothetical protein
MYSVLPIGTTTGTPQKLGFPNENRKRVLGIIAGILVARHLKIPDDLFEEEIARVLARWSLLRCNGPKE